MIDFVSFIPRAVVQSVPLLFGSTGETLTEKSVYSIGGGQALLIEEGTDNAADTADIHDTGNTEVQVTGFFG